MSDMVVGGVAGDFVVFEGIVADGIVVEGTGVEGMGRGNVAFVGDMMGLG